MRPLNSKEAQALGLEAPKPKKRRKTKAEIEQERLAFIRAAKAYGLPEPIPEWHFKVGGKRNPYRVDWFWESVTRGNVRFDPVALEIEGGAFRGHGHRSVGVFLRNMTKYNELALAGICLIRVTTDQVKSGECFGLVRRALGLNR